MPIHPDRKYTPIFDRTPAELDVMIQDAITAVGREHFYILLGGIDAYMEKRARKRKIEEVEAAFAEAEDGWTGR